MNALDRYIYNGEKYSNATSTDVNSLINSKLQLMEAQRSAKSYTTLDSIKDELTRLILALPVQLRTPLMTTLNDVYSSVKASITRNINNTNTTFNPMPVTTSSGSSTGTSTTNPLSSSNASAEDRLISEIETIISNMEGLSKETKYTQLDKLRNSGKSIMSKLGSVSRTKYRVKLDTTYLRIKSLIARNISLAQIEPSPARNFCATARCKCGCNEEYQSCNDCSSTENTDITLVDEENINSSQAGLFSGNKLAIIGGLALVLAGVGIFFSSKK